MPSFSIPLSGLKSASTALSVIANNLANLNTVSYKEQKVSFSDLYYQTIGSTGSGDPVQVGAGSGVSAITTNFTSGTSDSTGVSSDAAISGSGFFVINVNGNYEYTRDGAFTTSDDGYLVTTDGYQVLGFSATNGVIDTSTLAPIKVGKGQVNAPNPTSCVNMTTNLNANSDIGTSFSSSATVYDSLGQSHVLTYTYTKTDTNEWSYAITIPGEDVGQSTAAMIDSGTLTFDGSGNLVTPSADVTSIAISGLVDGASDLSFTWDLFGSNGKSNLTQMASASDTSATTQDGYASGTLTDFAINGDGTIEGAFTNGKKLLGQLVLASFANLQGLEREGSNNYSATLASGQAVIGTAGSGGRGTLTGGALELSNVDMSTEFANLITAQRGFQANAKAVTAFDEIMQTTINLKQ